MPREPQDIPDATLGLLLVMGLGPVTLRRLTENFQTHERILDATARELKNIQGIGDKTARTLRKAFDEVDPDRERDAMSACGARLIFHDDDDYPPLLSEIPDPPVGLWIRGQLAPSEPRIAIVGTRRCTTYGREQAVRLSALLTQSGLTVVSGGALGIDSQAHRGALRASGRTIAVLGCGVGVCYPPQHNDLFQRIIDEGGALVSEFPTMVEPLAQHFPRRNRIISGLSLGVLVIEAPLRSGALITARLAVDDHGREVMALPGQIDSPASAGCNQAIQEGWAALVVNHADILQHMDTVHHKFQVTKEDVSEKQSNQSASLFDAQLSSNQSAIMEVLAQGRDHVSIEQVAAQTQLLPSQIRAELTLLQIRGLIRQDHRGIQSKVKRS